MTLANEARRLNSGRLPALVLVTDAGRLPDPVAVAARLPAGAGVLLRDYHLSERARLASRLRAVCARRRLVLIVAGDWRLASRLGAAGIHLPEAMARGGRIAPAVGWARRTGRLVTVAAHSPMALAAARLLGADGAVLSPVFPTASHPGAPAIGATRFRSWARAARLPVIALGGVTAASARALHGFAAGLAAIGGWSK
ncbi:MAG: thiamine phosphate synthase [Pseudomonadota bacterium]